LRFFGKSIGFFLAEQLISKENIQKSRAIIGNATKKKKFTIGVMNKKELDKLTKRMLFESNFGGGARALILDMARKKKTRKDAKAFLNSLYQ